MTLLVVTIATGWCSVSYSWTGGSAQLGGGVVSAFHSDGSTFPQPPGRGWDARADWSNPRWGHSVDFAFHFGTARIFVSLVPFIIIASTLAAWAWYRFQRPFLRPNRPSPDRWARSRTPRGITLRWAATIASAFLLTIAIGSYWIRFEYRTATITVNGVWGGLHAGYNPAPVRPAPTAFTPPNLPPGTLPTEVIVPAPPTPPTGPTFSFLGPSGWPSWGGTVYQFHWKESGGWSHVVNLWFLFALSLPPTLFLLFIHLRSYPSMTHCPTCRYDRAGLPATAACPECGAAATKT